MEMFRKIIKIGFLLGLACVALSACQVKESADVSSPRPATVNSSVSKPDPHSVTVGLTYLPNVQFAPFYVAREEKLLAWKDAKGTSHKAEMVLRHHGGEEGLFNALLSGKEDMVVAFGDEAVQAMSQGMPLSVIGVLYQRYPVVVIARKDSGITAWRDLKGKTVGLPGRYGSNWFGFQAGLNAAGLSLEDVKVSEIGYTQQSQLATGKVDAVVGFSNNDLVRFRAAGIEVNTLSLPKDTPLVGAVIVTTQKFLAYKPEICRATVAAMAKAVHRITTDPSVAINVTKKYDQTLNSGQSVESARKVVNATNELIRLEHYNPADPGAESRPRPEEFRKMIVLLDRIGALSKKLDLTSIDGKRFAKLVWTGVTAGS